MNHVIILSYSDLIVIFVMWIIGTFIGGFIQAWIKDRFQQKILKRVKNRFINSIDEGIGKTKNIIKEPIVKN